MAGGGYFWVFPASPRARFRARRRPRSWWIATAGTPGRPVRSRTCYAHLRRDVEALGKELPESPEVAAFTGTLGRLLADAVHLQRQPSLNPAYSTAAAVLKAKIEAVVAQPAQHLGIRQLQEIFRANADRLYHWVTDRAVPPDNNRAEPELRPTVIARKVSFGSQSDAGAKTREILMSILHTLRKRRADAQAHFKWVLDQPAANPNRDSFALLFLNDTS